MKAIGYYAYQSINFARSPLDKCMHFAQNTHEEINGVIAYFKFKFDV
jgi:hypothetical protein